MCRFCLTGEYDSAIGGPSPDSSSSSYLYPSLHIPTPPAPKDTRVPITILAGFLGSGKSTLLQHLLTHNQDQRIAVIVNDMAAVNVDADLVRSTLTDLSSHAPTLLQMQNGCVCCTFRDELPKQIAELVKNSQQDSTPLQAVIVECSGIADPLQIAQTFAMCERDKTEMSTVARLDTLVTVVDSHKFFNDLESNQLLKARKDYEADPEDKRSVVELLVQQVETANVVILNKVDLLQPTDVKKVRAYVQSLNNYARVIEASFGRVAWGSVIATSRAKYMPNTAHIKPHQGELDTEVEHDAIVAAKHFGISSFVYKNDGCFAPQALSELFQSNLLQKANLIRSKGFVHVAGVGDRPVYWSHAGSSGVHLFPQAKAKKVDSTSKGEKTYSIEVVMIGVSLDEATITTALDNCVLPLDSANDPQYQAYSTALFEASLAHAPPPASASPSAPSSSSSSFSSSSSSLLSSSSSSSSSSSPPSSSIPETELFPKSSSHPISLSRPGLVIAVSAVSVCLLVALLQSQRRRKVE